MTGGLSRFNVQGAGRPQGASLHVRITPPPHMKIDIPPANERSPDLVIDAYTNVSGCFAGAAPHSSLPGAHAAAPLSGDRCADWHGSVYQARELPAGGRIQSARWHQPSFAT